jgi:Pyrimidine dimer DNA glycosylase
MRVWDVNPAYLNRQSLLGEHRDIRAIASIRTDGKRGYARHPETRCWAKALWAFKTRLDLGVSEMERRGDQHQSPVLASGAQGWPAAFIDTPGGQLSLLGQQYRHRAPGRIPLPRTLQP